MKKTARRKMVSVFVTVGMLVSVMLASTQTVTANHVSNTNTTASVQSVHK